MGRWMDIRLNEWMGRQTNGWVDGWMDRQTDELHEWMNVYMGRRMGMWMCEILMGE